MKLVYTGEQEPDNKVFYGGGYVVFVKDLLCDAMPIDEAKEFLAKGRNGYETVLFYDNDAKGALAALNGINDFVAKPKRPGSIDGDFWSAEVVSDGCFVMVHGTLDQLHASTLSGWLRQYADWMVGEPARKRARILELEAELLELRQSLEGTQ